MRSKRLKKTCQRVMSDADSGVSVTAIEGLDVVEIGFIWGLHV